MKSYFVFLGRNKLYTLINVLGLSVSLMFVIFIAIYVQQETTTDKFHEKADRIYVLGDEDSNVNHIGYSYYLRGRYPQIEDICTITTLDDMIANVRGDKIKIYTLFADPCFFDMFSYEIIDGNPHSPISDLSSIVLTESFARRVFGNESPIGKTVEIERGKGKSFVVTAIVRDFKNSIIVSPDIITYLDNAVYWEPLAYRTNIDQLAVKCNMFLLAQEGNDLKELEPDISQYFNELIPACFGKENAAERVVVLTPLCKVYLTDNSGSSIYQSGSGSLMRYGNRTFIRIMIFVCIVMLLFAVTNYVNLTVAQTTFRAKEMSTRRLLGATRIKIFRKFIFESTLACVIAFIFGLFLAASFENQLSTLLNTNIHIFESVSWTLAILFVLFVILLGVMSGLIPATIILRFKPIDVVRGSFAYHSKQRLSKLFITFQYAITILLFIGCSVAQCQITRMTNKPKGFNSVNMLYVDMYGLLNNYNNERASIMFQTIYDKMSNLPCVGRSGIISNAPGLGLTTNGARDKDNNIVMVSTIRCDKEAFGMLDFSTAHYDNGASADGNGVWINRALYNRLLSDSRPEVLTNVSELPILGIIDDYIVTDALEDDGIYKAVEVNDNIISYGILFEIIGDHADAVEQLEAVYAEYSSTRLDAVYIEQHMRDAYRKVDDQLKLVGMALLFAVIISALGLLAMSVYYINQRAGDIAIRKVFGSTRGEIIRRLLGKFLVLIVAAYLIAEPLAWWIMSEWLSRFSYRISLASNWWIFALAGVFIFTVAILTLLWQVVRAADSDPVKALKS